MSLSNYSSGVSSRFFKNSCISTSCTDMCPDFTIKRYDTKPPFKVSVGDCDGDPLDLTDENLVLEVNMWSESKLKSNISEDDTYFQLADNIAFDQIAINDIITINKGRIFEHMLVTGFDENNYFVRVQRGYNGTNSYSWKKGNVLYAFRLMNSTAEIELVREDVIQEDGTTLTNQLTDAIMVFEWTPDATCYPGCYWLEFKLMKMNEQFSQLQLLSNMSITPSFIPSVYMSNVNYGCSLSDGVEWVRRFPSFGNPFLIKVEDSPTMEF